MTDRPAIVILSRSAEPLAERLRDLLSGEIHALSSRASGDVTFDNAADHLGNLFREGHAIVALMASGAVIRLLAPHLGDKTREPPVLAVAEDGSAVVPLLGGHHGANDLAQQIADALDVSAAVTTAGDVRFGIALDAPPAGWVLADAPRAKDAMASLLAGASARIAGDAADLAHWLRDAALPVAENGAVLLTATTRPAGAEGLTFHPKVHHVGMGCERGVGLDELQALFEETLREADIAVGSVAGLYSIDVKADEVGLHALGQAFGLPVRFFDAERLEAETSKLQKPSEIVFAEVGCHGVSEGAALAASGADATLVVPKRKSARATIAVARAPEDTADLHGRARGSLSVVGIGPGSDEWRSPAVTDYVRRSTDLVGYSLYLDLLGPLAAGKERHDYPLGAEEDRVRHAMELAGQGRDVALVCSGDAGIYAMATLVFELLSEGGLSDGAQRIAIDVSPGISALQAAAARAGAPLGHDFCTISLSDLLTPWEDIQRRVKAAAEGDFVIAFYNPVSKRRRTQLAHARDVLLQHRPSDTPVILATNLGRVGEAVRVVPLAKLDVDDVDMLTVVIVGSSNTQTVRGGDGALWTYTPRGYAAKPGTGIGASA